MKRIALALALAVSMTSLLAQWNDLNSGITEDLLSIDFASVDTGFVAGTNTLYSTTDGGVNWSPVSISNSTGDSVLFSVCSFKEVMFVNGMWYAIGRDFTNYDPVIFRKSQTLGSEWELSLTGDSLNLNAMDGNSSLVSVVGSGGLVVYTTDLGVTWDTMAVGSGNNLKCISINSSNYTYIGSDYGFVVNGNFLSSNWYYYNNTGFEGVMTKSSGYLFGFNQNTFYDGSIFNFSEKSDYLGGLMPNHVEMVSDTLALFATPSGILKSFEDLDHWEYYPNTVGTNFKDVQLTFGSTAYAVGDSGAIFKTTNIYGPTIPTIIFDGFNGACDDSLLTFTNSGPLSYLYTWKVDGTVLSNQYNEDSTFTTSGSYDVTLIAQNGSIIDSLTYSFQIVDVPDTNKTISISDSILCKIGSTDITIQLSENNVEYQLLVWPSLTPVSTAIGNGGNAVLNTGIITDSTNYIISAKHVNAECKNYFTDTVLIAVEHTKAKFKPHLINADLGESVLFYNTSEQASLYDWTFSTGASSSTSILSEPQISYSQTGQTNSTLIATSVHGCSDTLSKNSSYIYNKNNYLDPSWAVGFEGVEIPSHEHDNAEAIRITANGDIVVTGSYNNVDFKSKAGNSSGGNFGIGFYIARYTSEGVLKWMVKGQDDGGASGTIYGVGICTDIILDAQENIYAVGQVGNGYTFHSNDGEVTNLDFPGNNDEGMILKLDSNGILQWFTGLDNADAKRVGLDANNNLYVSGDYHHSATFYSVSGAFVSYNTGWDGQKFVLKMDNQGEILWSTIFTSTSPNYYYYVNDMTVSPNGDLYIVGQYGGMTTTFYGVSGASMNLTSTYGAQGYIVKYNASGIVQWANKISSSSLTSLYDFSEVMCVEHDQHGNIYLGCDVTANETGEFVYIPSSNGSMDTVEIGSAILISYNSDGNFRWANGGAFSYIGRYTGVGVDVHGNVYGTGYVMPPSGSAGNSYTTFTSTGLSDTTVLTPSRSIFINKYDTSGNLIYVKMEYDTANPIGTVTAYPKGIQASESQHVYITANYQLFNGQSNYLLSTDLINPDGEDAFLIKFSPSGNLSQDTLFCYTNPGYLCSNEYVYLSSISGMNFGSSNIFTVQLSDSTGSFMSPINIGSIASTNLVDSVLVSIPIGVSGAGYRIRIHASNPNIIGNETSVNIADYVAGQYVINSLCQGDSLSLTAGVGANYQWSGTDSISDTTVVNPIIYPDSSAFILAQYINNCGLIVDSFDVVVNPSYASVLQEIHICDNDSVIVFGNYTSIPGLYIDTVQTINGCDSINSILLISHPTSVLTTSFTICSTDSLMVFGNYTNVPGLYADTAQSIYGCDSIIEIDLQVTPSYFMEIADTICSGDSSFFAGSHYKTTGVYYDNQLTSFGCDSVIMLALEVSNPILVSLDSFSLPTNCENGGLLPLPNAIPSGGIYTGLGVSGNYFDPTISGTGTHNLIYSVTDLDGCVGSDTSTIIIVNCTGIRTPELSFTDIRVFPNPNNGSFQIEIEGMQDKDFEIGIYNSVNAKVFGDNRFKSDQNVQSWNIDLTSYSKGIYFVQVRYLDKIKVKRIVIQ